MKKLLKIKTEVPLSQVADLVVKELNLATQAAASSTTIAEFH